MLVTIGYMVCVIGIVVSAYVAFRGIRMANQEQGETGSTALRVGGHALFVLGLLATVALLWLWVDLSQQSSAMQEHNTPVVPSLPPLHNNLPRNNNNNGEQ